MPVFVEDACSWPAAEYIMEEPEYMEEDDDFVMIGDTEVNKHKVTPELRSDLEYIFNTSIETIHFPADCPDIPDSPINFRSGRKLNNYEEKLELPRRLPPGHDISDNLVLVFEQPVTTNSMAFVIDWSDQTRNISLYHLVTRRFVKRCYNSCGFATGAGKLYYVGGEFPDHDNGYTVDQAEQQLIQEHGPGISASTPHLEVPIYNLRTRQWEEDTPCLQAPKPNPAVFVYDGKIFAIRGFYNYTIRDTSPSCKFLDTTATRPLWTPLPPPPFDMKTFYYHLFDQEKGVLFLFFKPPFFGDRHPTLPCCELDLNKEPYQWHHNSVVSESDPDFDSVPSSDLIDPDSAVGRRMRHIMPEEHYNYCIVDDVLFTNDRDQLPGKPLIIGRYVGGGETSFEPWVIEGLADHLKDEANIISNAGYLTHILEYRFCLILEYFTGRMTTAIYSLIFDLVKEYLPNEYIKIGHPGSSKLRKANKFTFKLKPICGKAFQVPLGFPLQFCQKL